MGFWRAVDWQRPWLAPYREGGEAACRHLDQGASVAVALDALAPPQPPALAAGPLHFVDSRELPPDEAYEAFIARTARVPTRDNLHDLFNGLVWLRFPALKRTLNELQAEQIARAGVGATRGAVRDALTLFDENAALWQAPALLVEALRERDWRSLFITHRDAWRDTRLTLFGHALMEKLVQPRKAITAHVWVLAQSIDTETQRVRTLTPESLAAKPCLALPVLGVPGWWPQNTSEGFYDDPGVFRMRRGQSTPLDATDEGDADLPSHEEPQSCMNSSGDNTMWVVPSCQGVFSARWWSRQGRTIAAESSVSSDVPGRATAVTGGEMGV